MSKRKGTKKTPLQIDEERKAAMVSNLLVVLFREGDTCWKMVIIKKIKNKSC